MAYESMKKQNFGIEIELTGITRGKAADVIAKYLAPGAAMPAEPMTLTPPPTERGASGGP